MGSWYNDLPDHCHDYWNFYDQALQQALLMKSTNLAECDLTKHLVMEFSGYQIIWLLTMISGDPALTTGTVLSSFPIQQVQDPLKL